MTPLILYTSEQVQGEATDKESLTVQTRNARKTSGPASADHFRGAREMVGLGHHRRALP